MRFGLEERSLDGPRPQQTVDLSRPVVRMDKWINQLNPEIAHLATWQQYDRIICVWYSSPKQFIFTLEGGGGEKTYIFSNLPVYKDAWL